MDVAVLRWLGPWRFITFMGQLEDDRDYPNALLFGMRIELRPLPSLQLAASRTAQWCGDGRPCTWDDFWNLFIGNDNDQSPEEQPGNQLAGFDLRWTWPGCSGHFYGVATNESRDRTCLPCFFGCYATAYSGTKRGDSHPARRMARIMSGYLWMRGGEFVWYTRMSTRTMLHVTKLGYVVSALGPRDSLIAALSAPADAFERLAKHLPYP